MALFMVTNQHQPDDCPELSDELGSYYETKTPSGSVSVYCNCGSGEHKMFFVVEGNSPAEVLQGVPGGFLRSATTITEVEEAYKFATGGG